MSLDINELFREVLNQNNNNIRNKTQNVQKFLFGFNANVSSLPGDLISSISSSSFAKSNEVNQSDFFELWLNRVLLVIYLIIFVVGLTGNFIVIYFVLFYKRMQTMTNKFITNLAVADLLVIFICVPITASRLLYDSWIFGRFMCRISGFAQGVSLSVSVLTLTAISIDRYYIIYKPMKARSICTNRKVKLVVIIIWLVAIFTMSPLLFVFEFREFTPLIPKFLLQKPESAKMTICIENWPSYETKFMFELFLILTLFILPSLFMSYAYYTVSKTLWLAQQNEAFNETSERKISARMSTEFVHKHDEKQSSSSDRKSKINNESKHLDSQSMGNSKDNINNNINNIIVINNDNIRKNSSKNNLRLEINYKRRSKSIKSSSNSSYRPMFSVDLDNFRLSACDINDNDIFVFEESKMNSDFKKELDELGYSLLDASSLESREEREQKINENYVNHQIENENNFIVADHLNQINRDDPFEACCDNKKNGNLNQTEKKIEENKSKTNFKTNNRSKSDSKLNDTAKKNNLSPEKVNTKAKKRYSNSIAINSLVNQLNIYKRASLAASNKNNLRKNTSKSNLEQNQQSPNHITNNNNNCNLYKTSPIQNRMSMNNNNNSIRNSQNKNSGCSKLRNNQIAINKLITSRRRVVKLLIILVVAFLISWLPYYIISFGIDFFIFHVNRKSNDSTKMKMNSNSGIENLDRLGSSPSLIFLSKNVFPFVICLALANSASNPVCYIALSHGFRSMFKSTFKKFKNKTGLYK